MYVFKYVFVHHVGGRVYFEYNTMYEWIMSFQFSVKTRLEYEVRWDLCLNSYLQEGGDGDSLNL